MLNRLLDGITNTQVQSRNHRNAKGLAKSLKNLKTTRVRKEIDWVAKEKEIKEKQLVATTKAQRVHSRDVLIGVFCIVLLIVGLFVAGMYVGNGMAVVQTVETIKMVTVQDDDKILVLSKEIERLHTEIKGLKAHSSVAPVVTPYVAPKVIPLIRGNYFTEGSKKVKLPKWITKWNPLVVDSSPEQIRLHSDYADFTIHVVGDVIYSVKVTYNK